MEIFEITNRIKAVCEWKETRTAFKHEATLFVDGRECEKVKICYLNRTWEAYPFQSVLQKLIGKTTALTDEEKKQCMAWTKQDHERDSGFKTIAAIAQLGEIFGKTKEEKNDWKERMLKAGLTNQGLEMPDDWNSLNEDEKETRLNAVISVLKK